MLCTCQFGSRPENTSVLQRVVVKFGLSWLCSTHNAMLFLLLSEMQMVLPDFDNKTYCPYNCNKNDFCEFQK
jgi:hypothetical protein